MRTTRLLSVVAAVAFSGACVCVVGSTTGDLSIYYTFGGRSCDAAGVDRIYVDVSGLHDGATRTVSCAAFGTGIVFQGLLPESYDVTVEGDDASGRTIYGTDVPVRARVIVGSSNSVSVDVPALFGDLSVTWQTFDGEASCAAAGVQDVAVYLYDETGALEDSGTFACSAGGVDWVGLDPGQRVVGLDALDGAGNIVYTATVSTDVQAGGTNTALVSLVGVGTLTVYWTFEGSAACGAVTDVHVQATDPFGFVYDASTYPCDYKGVVYDTAAAGSWHLTLTALDASGLQLYAAENHPANVERGEESRYTIDLKAP